MHSTDPLNNRQKTQQTQSTDPEGACTIMLQNGNKECVLDRSKSECSSICDQRPGSQCEWSNENACPRGQ